MNLQNLFKPKAYKEGFKAGSANADQLNNPYKDDATHDNIKRGMGLSPWWDTKYKPFIEWNQGWTDGRQPLVDKYLDETISRMPEEDFF